MAAPLALLLYFAMTSAVAFLSYRKQRSTEDFLMGGRSLNFYLTALSAHASDMSSWLFIAFPAAIYLRGIQEAWLALGLLLGMYANWSLVAKPLRIASEQKKTLSLPSFLESHFNDKSGVIRLVSASALIFFFILYIASGLQGISSLFQPLFQLPYSTGVVGAAIMVLVYTLFGGFVTVAWTDLFQALFLLAVILFTPLLASINLQFDHSSLWGIDPLKNSSPFFVAIFLSLGWGLGYFGQPHILSKFMGIQKPQELKKSRRVGITWQFFALGGAMAVGIVGKLQYPQGLEDPERLFIQLVQDLFSPFFASFILCGILAATLSTIDTMLLVLTTSLSEDFFDKYLPSTTDLEKLKLAKISLVIAGVLACLIAYARPSSIFDLVSYAWAGLGSIFGPLLLSALYQNKVPAKTAIKVLIGSFALSVFWPYVSQLALLKQLQITGVMALSDIPTMILSYSYSLLLLAPYGLKEKI